MPSAVLRDRGQRWYGEAGRGDVVGAEDGQVVRCGPAQSAHPGRQCQGDLVVVGAHGRGPAPPARHRVGGGPRLETVSVASGGLRRPAGGARPCRETVFPAREPPGHAAWGALRGGRRWPARLLGRRAASRPVSATETRSGRGSARWLQVREWNSTGATCLACSAGPLRVVVHHGQGEPAEGERPHQEHRPQGEQRDAEELGAVGFQRHQRDPAGQEEHQADLRPQVEATHDLQRRGARLGASVGLRTYRLE